jgi:AraC family transcriptional activator of pobA
MQRLDLESFASDKKDCFTSENGLMIWKIKGGAEFEPSIFKNDETFYMHIVLVEGALEVRSGKDTLNIQRNSFVNLIDRNEYELVDASYDIFMYVIVCLEEFMKKAIWVKHPFSLAFLSVMHSHPVMQLSHNHIRKLEFRAQCLWEVAAEEGHIFRDWMIRNALRMLLMDVSNIFSQTSGTGKDPSSASRSTQLFLKFIKEMVENINREHSVRYYASKLCISIQYLNKLVRAHTGKSTSEYLGNFLVTAIIMRLENTDESMQQIADDLNFSDQSALAKFFKRRTGQTLTAFRKSQR